MTSELRQNRKRIILLLVIVAGLGMILPACQKSSNGSANNSFLSITHAAPFVQPLDAYLAGNLITSSGKIAYGSTSGVPGNPYLAAHAGTANLQFSPDGSQYYVSGTVSMLPGRNYSAFVFDTLSSGNLKSILLEDILSTPAAGYAGFRFINLAFDTLSLLLIQGTDTLVVPEMPYAGSLQNPYYLSPFSSIPAGDYQTISIMHALALYTDSVHLVAGKDYSVYAAGVRLAAPPAALAIRQIQHN